MNRRELIKKLAPVAVAGPLMVAGALVQPEKKRLPECRNGQMLTAEAWNNLIRRVNELSA